MKRFRLLLTTLLVTSLISPQVLAETGAAPASSPVITAGGSSEDVLALSTSTSAPSTVYPGGSYHVGTDIPSGEYVLLAEPSASGSTYIIYADGSEGAEYVDYNMFSYNAIIYIEDGQVLDLSGCAASPINEIPQLDHLYGSMYKVGYHIPAGTYELKILDSSSYGIAYVLSYPSDNYDVVEDYTIMESSAVITVNNGQYLQLDNCILSGAASADSVAQDSGRSFDSWYDEWTGITEGDISDGQHSPVITAGSLIPGLPTKTSAPSTVYQPGTYQVGTDIPAGEYVLLGNDLDADEYYSSLDCTYMISSIGDPVDMEQILDYGFFEYNFITRVEEGQFLILDNCTASPIEQVSTLDYRKAELFKVGYHIPAGTYHFRSDSYGAAYILSAPFQSYEKIVDYTSTPYYTSDNQTISLTVQEGQYLYLVECVFTDNGASSGSPGPGGEGTNPQTAAYTDYFN